MGRRRSNRSGELPPEELRQALVIAVSRLTSETRPRQTMGVPGSGGHVAGRHRHVGPTPKVLHKDGETPAGGPRETAVVTRLPRNRCKRSERSG